MERRRCCGLGCVLYGKLDALRKEKQPLEIENHFQLIEKGRLGGKQRQKGDPIAFVVALSMASGCRTVVPEKKCANIAFARPAKLDHR